MNSQASTREQVERLYDAAIGLEYSPETLLNLGEHDVRNLMRHANWLGLYDAADFLERQIGTSPVRLIW